MRTNWKEILKIPITVFIAGIPDVASCKNGTHRIATMSNIDAFDRLQTG